MAFLFYTSPGQIPSINSTQKSFPDLPFVEKTMAARFMSRRINAHCKAYVNPYYEFQHKYRRSIYLGEINCNQIAPIKYDTKTIMWTSPAKTYPLQLRIYFVNLSLLSCSRMTTYHSTLAEELWHGYRISPIPTGYEHHQNCMGSANEKLNVDPSETLQATCSTALEWTYSSCQMSPLSQNTPAYLTVTSYAWFSYRIRIYDIIWIHFQ